MSEGTKDLLGMVLAGGSPEDIRYKARELKSKLEAQAAQLWREGQVIDSVVAVYAPSKDWLYGLQMWNPK